MRNSGNSNVSEVMSPGKCCAATGFLSPEGVVGAIKTGIMSRGASGAHDAEDNVSRGSQYSV